MYKQNILLDGIFLLFNVVQNTKELINIIVYQSKIKTD